MAHPIVLYDLLRLRGLWVGFVALGVVLFGMTDGVRGDDVGAGAGPPIQQTAGDLLGGVQRAVCYSGFRKGQHPDRGEGANNPSDAQVLEDLKLLSRDGHFRMIRLYDAGENSETVLRLIKQHGLDIKVLLGAWLGAEVSNPGCPWHPEPYPDAELEANKRANQQELDRAIALAKRYPDIVAAVAVGNETLVAWNDHMVPVERVIGYVRYVKGRIEQPVTVADNFDWWRQHGQALAKELDFVSVHTYPQWEGKRIGEALAFSIQNIQAVRDTLPDSRLVITEAGWASRASEFGDRAGQAQQKQYFDQLNAWCARMNISLFFFEAFDESWKGDPNNPDGAEKHWGLFTEDRRPKQAVQAVQAMYPDLTPAAADQ